MTEQPRTAEGRALLDALPRSEPTPRAWYRDAILAIEAQARPAVASERAALDVALAEFDNIRWDDIWSRVDASGDDELARMSRKYSLYVRDAIVEARAALAAEEER